MVNPTGYTALDLIGFTDKDAYSSSANYVKNDLVHYGGNIWRCLIDDTSGIAPAEGVNWTLFIGEPTNLVERIIAPVETDPATSAWAVGRQIIFNDNLYEVIAAITAGDSLVAYEDDPTNANIKLADPVETQLLNEKAARAAADLALQNSLKAITDGTITAESGFTLGSDNFFKINEALKIGLIHANVTVPSGIAGGWTTVATINKTAYNSSLLAITVGTSPTVRDALVSGSNISIYLDSSDAGKSFRLGSIFVFLR